MFDLVNALNQMAPEHQAWVRLHYVYPYPHVGDVLPLMAEFSEHMDMAILIFPSSMLIQMYESA